MSQNSAGSKGIKPGFAAVVIVAAAIIIGVPIYQMLQKPTMPLPAEPETPAVEVSADREREPKPPKPPKSRETAPATEPERELRGPVMVDFIKDETITLDIDGDGVEDTLTVLRGSSYDTLAISSSRFGEYSEAFDYAFPPEYVQLVAIDTGNDAYSLCVAADNGGNGGAGGLDGLILYGALDGWVKIASLMDLSYSFDSELTRDLGASIGVDGRISSISYAVDANTGEYDFMLGQYLFSGPVVNGVGFGYTQVHIDAASGALVTVDQWVRTFGESAAVTTAPSGESR